MPEGDTIHRLAAALRDDLTNAALDGLWLRDRGRVDALRQHRVREVSALGKHLLMGLAAPGKERAEWVLHVHLGMYGRWHRGACGRPDRGGSISAASLHLEGGGTSHVCVRAATAALLRAAALPLHPTLSRLGPDLLAPRLDVGRVVARARRREPRSAADLLLDQTVACGIGNVYKSEVLFLEGVHPRARVDALCDATLARLYRRARRLMACNLGPGPRVTLAPRGPGAPMRRGDARFWVYERAARPCRRCGTPIEVSRTGDAARSTFHCPRCQERRQEDAAS